MYNGEGWLQYVFSLLLCVNCLQRKLKKKRDAGKDSDRGKGSALELKDCSEGTSVTRCSVKNCENSQEEKEPDPEANVNDESGSETATVKVCKHQAMLQEEEERPHYNPHQGEHFFHVHTHAHTCKHTPEALEGWQCEEWLVNGGVREMVSASFAQHSREDAWRAS